MILIDPGLSLHKGHCLGILCRQCCCKSIRFLKSTSKNAACCRQRVFRSLTKHGQIWRHVTFHVKIEGHFGRIPLAKLEITQTETNIQRTCTIFQVLFTLAKTLYYRISMPSKKKTRGVPNAVGEKTRNWFVGSPWCIPQDTLFQILLGSTYFLRWNVER